MGYQSGEESGPLLPRSGAPSATESSSPRHRAKWLTALLLVGAAAFASGSLWSRFGATENSSKTITVELEGNKHKKSSKSDHHESTTTHLQCDDGKYSKRTLKLAYELPFASLFLDTKGQRKYEASSVVVVDDDAYAVCDSSWAISKFSRELQPFSETNVQIGAVEREGEDSESGYEALIHDNGIFYVVRESIQHEDESYHAIIEELALGADDYEVQDQCSCEFKFEGDSKGKFVAVFRLWLVIREIILFLTCILSSLVVVRL